jgi:hypothetical protein
LFLPTRRGVSHAAQHWRFAVHLGRLPSWTAFVTMGAASGPQTPGLLRRRLSCLGRPPNPRPPASAFVMLGTAPSPRRGVLFGGGPPAPPNPRPPASAFVTMAAPNSGLLRRPSRSVFKAVVTGGNDVRPEAARRCNRRRWNLVWGPRRACLGVGERAAPAPGLKRHLRDGSASGWRSAWARSNAGSSAQADSMRASVGHRAMSRGTRRAKWS